MYHQIRSVAQSCPTLCDPLNHSKPGLPVYHQLPEFTETQVHRIQWCHPTISSSVIPFFSCLQTFPTFNLSQHQGKICWGVSSLSSGDQSIGVSPLASVLPKNTQDWSPLEWTGWISLQSKGLSRVFSNTTVQKHKFFGTQSSSQSNFHIHTWPLEKP